MSRLRPMLIALFSLFAVVSHGESAKDNPNAQTKTCGNVTDQPTEDVTPDPIGLVSGNAYDGAVDLRIRSLTRNDARI